MAELVDALDLGSSGETRPGSSPGFRMFLFVDLAANGFRVVVVEIAFSRDGYVFVMDADGQCWTQRGGAIGTPALVLFPCPMST